MALIIPIFGRLSRIHVMSFLTGWLFKPDIFFRNYKVRERFVRYYAMIHSWSNFKFVIKVIYLDYDVKLSWSFQYKGIKQATRNGERIIICGLIPIELAGQMNAATVPTWCKTCAVSISPFACFHAFNRIIFVIKIQNEILVLQNSSRITLRKIMISKYSQFVCDSWPG